MTKPFKVQAVLFDCYGVVLDNNFAQYISWKRLLDEQGIPFTIVDFQMKATGGTREEGIRQIMGELSQEKIKELGDRKQEIFNEIREMNPPELFPGIFDLLSTLKKRGLLTAIVSASMNAKEDTSRVHLDRVVSAIVEPSMVKKGHVCDKDLFQVAMETLNVHPAQCIVVEDAPRSIKNARELGAYVIGIATNVPAVALQDAHVIVQGHTELRDLLLRLCTPGLKK